MAITVLNGRNDRDEFEMGQRENRRITQPFHDGVKGVQVVGLKGCDVRAERGEGFSIVVAMGDVGVAKGLFMAVSPISRRWMRESASQLGSARKRTNMVKVGCGMADCPYRDMGCGP